MPNFYKVFYFDLNLQFAQLGTLQGDIRHQIELNLRQEHNLPYTLGLFGI